MSTRLGPEIHLFSSESRRTLTLQPLLKKKNKGNPPKKSKGFLFAEPLKSLEKKGKTPQKKQGKSENKKNKESEKSKDWRVREIRSKSGPNQVCGEGLGGAGAGGEGLAGRARSPFEQDSQHILSQPRGPFPDLVPPQPWRQVGSFVQRCMTEQQKMEDGKAIPCRSDMLARGFYAQQLARILRYYPMKQVAQGFMTFGTHRLGVQSPACFFLVFLAPPNR